METIEYLKNRCEQQEREIMRLKSILECVKQLLSEETESSRTDSSLQSYTPPSTLKKFAPTRVSSAHKSPMLGSSSVGVKRRLELQFENNAQDLDETNPQVSLTKTLTSTKNLTAVSPTSPILGLSSKGKKKSRNMLRKSKSLHRSQDLDETFWEGAKEKLQLTKDKEVQEFECKSHKISTKMQDASSTSAECDKQIIENEIKKQGAKGNTQRHKKMLESSYDRLPAAKEPTYAYKSKPVRGSKRKQLPGRACYKCKEYYDAAGVSVGKCSKHRAKHSPVRTPPGYWSLEFPSTQELRARQAATPSP